MSNASSSEPKPQSRLVPWSAWLGFFLVVFVFLAAQIITSILVSYYPALRGWSSTQATDWLNNSLGAQFSYILLTSLIILGSLYLFIRAKGNSFRAIGLRRPKASDFLYSLAAFPLYLILFVIVVGVVQHFVPNLNLNQQQQLGFNGSYHGAQLLVVFVSLVILPPLTEEILFRGFLYSSLKKAMPVVTAALLTSALFAAGHLPEGGSAGPLYIAGVDTFVLSLVLIYLREKTGGIWASIGLHAIKNAVAFTAVFLLHAK